MSDDETSQIYAAIGSDQPFYDLVEAFYHNVENQPLLRSLYPTDLTKAKEHLALFLIQRFGGHEAYHEQRGHPRLRMRHVPFRIGAGERDIWLDCMRRALDATPAFDPFRAALESYFSDTAQFLVNHHEIPAIGVTEKNLL